MSNTTQCPDCGALLPEVDGPTHRYIGASPACWQLQSNLVNGGTPPLAPAPLNALLVDAYAAQHPSTPSPQAIQSVAVHLLTLHGVLARGVNPNKVLWLRRRPLRGSKEDRHGRFQWLTPPSFASCLTVADIVAGATAVERTNIAQEYVKQVHAVWSEAHQATIATWYNNFIVADKLK